MYQTSVKLPAGSSPSLPVSVILHESFATTRSIYSFTGGMLHSERRLTTKVEEIPVDQFEAYRAFTKAITDDEDTYIPLNIVSSGGSGGGQPSRRDRRGGSGPSQGNPEAQALLRETQQAIQRGDAPLR